MKTWTGILLMIILAVATITTTSAARTTNESKKQINIDASTSQTAMVEASHMNEMNDDTESKPSNTIKKDDIVVAPENKNVRIYPKNVEGSGYIYDGIVVEANGKKREFSEWRAEGGSYRPEVHELDLNGDGNKEIVVLYTEGHGTGINLGKARILNPATLEEMKMQTLDDIVKQHVESTVTVASDRIDVGVSIDGTSAESNRMDGEPSDVEYYKELKFGEVTYYSVENGKLVVSASGAYGVGLYAGDLTFTYSNQGGEWKATDVKYSMQVYEDGYYESFD